MTGCGQILMQWGVSCLRNVALSGILGIPGLFPLTRTPKKAPAHRHGRAGYKPDKPDKPGIPGDTVQIRSDEQYSEV